MQLPQEIHDLLNVDSATEIHIGKSKSRVFRILGKSGEHYYLKTSDSVYVANEIEREIKVMKWLNQRGILVPTLIKFVRMQSVTFFLMSEVAGRSLAETCFELGPIDCIRLGAKYLRDFHLLSIDDCPFDRRLEVTKKLAFENLKRGLVDESDFDPENMGNSAQELYDSLDSSSLKEDLVFTHGDYCFPNIICLDGQVTGTVDLGRAGIADRYQDISLFLRSCKTNLCEINVAHFLKEYALISSIDEAKVKLYKKLDEFF